MSDKRIRVLGIRAASMGSPGYVWSITPYLGVNTCTC